MKVKVIVNGEARDARAEQVAIGQLQRSRRR